MSLNMLIEFGDAFDYTGADFRGWCSEVGFKRFEFIGLTALLVLQLPRSNPPRVGCCTRYRVDAADGATLAAY
jgi:hypothetical protein